MQVNMFRCRQQQAATGDNCISIQQLILQWIYQLRIFSTEYRCGYFASKRSDYLPNAGVTAYKLNLPWRASQDCHRCISEHVLLAPPL